MEAPKSRNGRSEFLLEGLEVLAADGPRALTAARMARELNVTTGSFYWHFRSISEFHDELKNFWRDDIVIGIINEAREQADNPGSILEIIGQIVKRRGTYRYDRAMRGWASSDRKAALVVEAADEVRGKLIKEVIQNAGEEEEAATDKTNLLGAAWLGTQEMQNPDYRFKLLDLIMRDADPNR